MAQANTTFPRPTTDPNPPSRRKAAGTQQPKAFPIFRWRPARVSGTPICLDNLDFGADKPLARFQEKPGIPLRLPIASSLSSTSSTCLPDYFTATSTEVLGRQPAELLHVFRMSPNRREPGLANQVKGFPSQIRRYRDFGPAP